ncbi:nickel responsive regulator [Aeropyrum pernix]|uniref:Nickel responsive regulator n=1 Tax=Aeropyrum pernix TaxID=56636 RepID=A0A401HBZ6_AERPX|nr:nickel responsive regulator [Aeropyrum pernix]
MRGVVTVVSVSLPDHLVRKVDRAVEEYGFKSRSDLIKTALQAFLEDEDNKASGSYRLIVVLSDHKSSPYVDKNIVGLIHSYSEELIALYHQILQGPYCITIAVVGGKDDWRTIVKKLRSLNGVLSVQSLPV